MSRVSPPLPLPEEVVKPIEVENVQRKHVYPVATTQAAAEPVTELTLYSGKSVEETAAVKIQTVFRGYLV